MFTGIGSSSKGSCVRACVRGSMSAGDPCVVGRDEGLRAQLRGVARLRSECITARGGETSHAVCGCGRSKQASGKQFIRAADTAGSKNAVCGRRRGKQASGKRSLSALPPTIYHSNVLSHKQVINNPSH